MQELFYFVSARDIVTAGGNSVLWAYLYHPHMWINAVKEVSCEKVEASKNNITLAS